MRIIEGLLFLLAGWLGWFLIAKGSPKELDWKPKQPLVWRAEPELKCDDGDWRIAGRPWWHFYIVVSEKPIHHN